MDKVKLGIHRLHDDSVPPSYGTEEAACFDIRAYISVDAEIKAYGPAGLAAKIKPNRIAHNPTNKPFIDIQTGYRYLIPTGLIFDIPLGYNVRLYSRSGLALKQGISLANGVGVIDSDYHHETYIMIETRHNQVQRIYHGDRIAQGDLVPVVQTQFIDATHPSEKREVNREGGFGSTGV